MVREDEWCNSYGLKLHIFQIIRTNYLMIDLLTASIGKQVGHR